VLNRSGGLAADFDPHRVGVAVGIKVRDPRIRAVGVGAERDPAARLDRDLSGEIAVLTARQLEAPDGLPVHQDLDVIEMGDRAYRGLEAHRSRRVEMDLVAGRRAFDPEPEEGAVGHEPAAGLDRRGDRYGTARS